MNALDKLAKTANEECVRSGGVKYTEQLVHDITEQIKAKGKLHRYFDKVMKEHRKDPQTPADKTLDQVKAKLDQADALNKDRIYK